MKKVFSKFVLRDSLTENLFALMSILSQSFFTLMRSHLVSFLLFTAWHNL